MHGYYCKKIAARIAALSGTVQLSSPSGSSSIIAHAAVINAIRRTNSLIANGNIRHPVNDNHATIPVVHKNADTQKAREPAIDLLSAKNHLLPFPNRLPTRSAIPSPAAMVHNAVTPIKFSLQNRQIAPSKTRT